MSAALVLAGALIALMTAVEVLQLRRVRRVTFLSAVHLLIAIGYCLPAFFIALLPGTRWAVETISRGGPNPWGTRFYILDLFDHLNLAEGAFISAGIILLGAYAALLAGYFVVRPHAPKPLNGRALPRNGLIAGGITLGGIAFASMIVYASQFDGVSDLISSGLYVRRGTDQVRWGYLQVLAQVGLPAFLILTASALRLNGWPRAALAAAAALIWAVTAVRVLHVAGRLEIAAFLVIPLLAWAFVARSQIKAAVVTAALGALALFVAGLDTTSFRDLAANAGVELAALASHLTGKILFMLTYLGFPHVAAAHTLTVVPNVIDFRYFVDIPLGALYMLPNFSGVETLPPMILSLHVALLPWIPVDLFSFGYYSLGTVGVLIIFAAFGAVLALFDGWLTESAGWLGQALRAAWLFYLPFRLLFADPYATLQSGFGLIAGTALVAALAVWAGRRRRKA